MLAARATDRPAGRATSQGASIYDCRREGGVGSRNPANLWKKQYRFCGQKLKCYCLKCCQSLIFGLRQPTGHWFSMPDGRLTLVTIGRMDQRRMLVNAITIQLLSWQKDQNIPKCCGRHIRKPPSQSSSPFERTDD